MQCFFHLVVSLILKIHYPMDYIPPCNEFVLCFWLSQILLHHCCCWCCHPLFPIFLFVYFILPATSRIGNELFLITKQCILVRHIKYLIFKFTVICKFPDHANCLVDYLVVKERRPSRKYCYANVGVGERFPSRYDT